MKTSFFRSSVYRLLILLATFLSPLAEAKVYKVELNGRQGVKFQLPYTAGTHTGLASALSGTAKLSELDSTIESVTVQVPIDSISTGNKTRDCHMREAMGINYIGSDFPKEHVCDNNNQIPIEGPNSVVYPLIEFTLVPNLAGEFPRLIIDEVQASNLAITGKIKMHGIEKDLKSQGQEVLNIKVAKLPNSSNLRVMANFEIVLADFDIQVKPFKVGPIEIGVGERAKVNLDLILVPVP